MANRGSNPGTTRVQESRWLFWVRCCLFLAAWQGPLPWCHYHGTLAEVPPQSRPKFQEHLVSFHSGSGQADELLHAWHIHLDFPDNLDETDQSCHEPATQRRANAPAFSAQKASQLESDGLTLVGLTDELLGAYELIATVAADCIDHVPGKIFFILPHAFRPAALRC